MTALDSFALALSGEPATAAELRRALAELRADGFRLVHRDELFRLRLAALGQTAPDGPAGARARRLAVYGLLADDVDLFAEAIVEIVWAERRAA